MSLFNYFKRTKPTDATEACKSVKENLPENISILEANSVQERLNAQPSIKRFTHKEGEKQEIAKYSHTHGTAAAVRKFKKLYPSLSESTIRPWLKRYRKF